MNTNRPFAYDPARLQALLFSAVTSLGWTIKAEREPWADAVRITTFLRKPGPSGMGTSGFLAVVTKCPAELQALFQNDEEALVEQLLRDICEAALRKALQVSITKHPKRNLDTSHDY